MYLLNAKMIPFRMNANVHDKKNDRKKDSSYCECVKANYHP